MAKNHTKLEALMKKIGDICNVNYRFHKVKAHQNHRGAFVMYNGPRIWNFEWWKRVPGNPLNRYGSEFGQSELHVVPIPDSISLKDDAIEHILFKSNFFEEAYGASINSYDALNIAFGLLSKDSFEIPQRT